MNDYDIEIEHIYIPKDAKIVLDKKLIQAEYKTYGAFADAYEIPMRVVDTGCRDGVLWGTVNRNDNISKRYIDWDKTDWELVSDAVKNAHIIVDLHSGKEIV